MNDLMHLIRTMCVAAVCAVCVACGRPPGPGPEVAPGVSPSSYNLRQGCIDVLRHATDTWGVIPQFYDGPFKDMFVGGERVGCRFSASLPAGEVEARFTALKQALLADGWYEDEYAASGTTAGMWRGKVVCYSRFQRDPATAEIECFAPPSGGWPPP